MANNERRVGGFDAKRKKGTDVLMQSRQLMENRLNTSGDSVTYTVTNRMIENAISDFILNNMSPDDERRFMVQCGWNRDYDQVITTGKQNGADPFVISIYAEVNNREKGMQRKIKAGNRMMQRTYNRIMHEASSVKQKQFKLMMSRQLNAVIASLALFNKKGEIVWEARDKKGKWAECPLDPMKVLEYAFKMDDDNAADKFCFDIIDVAYSGKGKSGNKKGERYPEFSMRIAKVRISKNFKHANRDRFEFLARRRRK